MKKIPTLFERVFENHNVKYCLPSIPFVGGDYVLLHGTPTVKYDGACCAIIDGVFYKRYDAKKGKQPPVGAIPCGEPDPITGHFPHWVKVDEDNPSDKWFIEAYKNTDIKETNGTVTYEAIGVHFQGNPYELDNDMLIRHGCDIIEDLDERTFGGIEKWLKIHHCEGIVFWLDGEPKCKIKRTDFGFEWNGKNKKCEISN